MPIVACHNGRGFVMDKNIEIGDIVRYQGVERKVLLFAMYCGLYFLSGGVWAYRYELSPIKWEGDIIGNTGIGVCAKNGSEQ